MVTDTLGGWSLEELDRLNVKAGGSPYWTVKQFGFTDLSVPYMYSHLTYYEAVELAQSRGLGPEYVGVVLTIYPETDSDL